MTGNTCIPIVLKKLLVTTDFLLIYYYNDLTAIQPERTSGREINIGLAADDGSCLVDVNTRATVAATPVVDIAPTGDVHDDDIVNLSQNDDDDDAAADDTDSEDEGNVSVSDFVHWTDYSYVKPLRVIYQLSAYPMLTTLYKILSSIAVTSCSAERTLMSCPHR
jgi:hypothetical protein